MDKAIKKIKQLNRFIDKSHNNWAISLYNSMKAGLIKEVEAELWN